MSERSDAVDAWEALFRAQVSVLRQLHEEFPTNELSLNEYDVLFALSRQDGREARIRDLNKHLFLSQPSVSRLIDRLVARGLATKRADEGDARGTVVALTPAGYQHFRDVAVVHGESIYRRVSAALTPAELKTLRELSEKLRLGGATEK